MNLIASIMADPRIMRAAEVIGITHQHFEQDDLRLIYLATDVARSHLKATVLSVAKAALIDGGWWDRGHPPLPAGDSSSTWNDAKLIRMACCFPPSPATVEQYARQLLAVVNHIENARGHYRGMLHELREAGDPISRTQLRTA